MTRSSLSTLLLLAVACSVGTRLPRSPRGQEVLQVRGELKGAPFRLGEADLASLKQGKVRGVDPVTGRDATYEGVDLAALLDRLDSSAGIDTLVVRTADRRAVAVPFSVLRELRPVLAARAGGAPLEGRLVAWPNVAHHGLNTDPRAALWWARDVVALEYVSWARAFGRALRLPEGAPVGALAGATAFASRCLACHRIRQAGGGNGPDLARAGLAPTVEKLAGVLPDHPGWASSGAEAPPPEVVSQLAAFLGTVARTPAEDVGDLDMEVPARRQPPTF